MRHSHLLGKRHIASLEIIAVGPRTRFQRAILEMPDLKRLVEAIG
ncbi:hypothetical protein [Microcoleus sp. B4-D4]